MKKRQGNSKHFRNKFWLTGRLLFLFLIGAWSQMEKDPFARTCAMLAFVLFAVVFAWQTVCALASRKNTGIR